MTLSVCLIVRNEEEVICRCLDCVRRFADEIIVVDTGSTDRTVELSKGYTDKVYFFEWCDDFSAARNFAFSKANCDYLFWIDADDIISKEASAKIKEYMLGCTADIIYLPYVSGEDGTFRYSRERIFKRSMNFTFKGAVHECVEPRGKTDFLNAEIRHKKMKIGDPLRNLKIYQKLISSGISLTEREKFYYGRELLFNGMKREGVAVLENFLSGDGWVENKIEACYDLFQTYLSLGDGKMAFAYLLQTLNFSPPRSRFCCYIGEKFMAEGDIDSAIYWYKTAIERAGTDGGGAFVDENFYGFIPYMQLCVLYYKKGDIENSISCNEEAGKIKPDDKNYLYNKQFFSGISK